MQKGMDSRGHVVSCDDRISFLVLMDWLKDSSENKVMAVVQAFIHREAGLHLLHSVLINESATYRSKHSACGHHTWGSDPAMATPRVLAGTLDWAMPHNLCIFCSHHNALSTFEGKSMQKGAKAALCSRSTSFIFF
jgi:hypothetical protein